MVILPHFEEEIKREDMRDIMRALITTSLKCGNQKVGYIEMEFEPFIFLDNGTTVLFQATSHRMNFVMLCFEK